LTGEDRWGCNTKKQQNHYMPANPTKYARALRKNATQAEAMLWSRLRARQIEGAKFRRQQPLENFIVDFVNFEKRIVIELDGGQHAEDKAKDEERDICLKDNGFTILRFWNSQVFENLEGVLETIRQKCIDR